MLNANAARNEQPSQTPQMKHKNVYLSKNRPHHLVKLPNAIAKVTKIPSAPVNYQEPVLVHKASCAKLQAKLLDHYKLIVVNATCPVEYV